jgi:hypothetical protein
MAAGATDSALDSCGHRHCLGGLGSAAMNEIHEAERDRARRYRDYADECRRNAAETKDTGIRTTLMQLAALYDLMANGIDDRLDAPNSN